MAHSLDVDEIVGAEAREPPKARGPPSDGRLPRDGSTAVAPRLGGDNDVDHSRHRGGRRQVSSLLGAVASASFPQQAGRSVRRKEGSSVSLCE